MPLSVPIRTNETFGTLYTHFIDQLAAKITTDDIDVELKGIKISKKIKGADAAQSILGSEITFSFFAQLISDQKLIAKGAVMLMPPKEYHFSSAVTMKNITTTLEITASFSIDRASAHLDPNHKKVQEIASVTADLNPNLKSNTASSGTGLSLRSFAEDCEAAAGGAIKVMTGKDASGNDGLLAVPLGSAITYSPEKELAFFAPLPLSNAFLTRSDVPVKSYNPGQGLYTTPPKNFVKVDLDSWGRTFLDTLDEFLHPANAFAIREMNNDRYTALVSAKQKIAQAISASVEPIIQNPEVSDWSDQQAQAQAVLYKELLEKLSMAYEVDAIVNQPLTVQSSDVGTPLLKGKPLVSTYTISKKNTFYHMQQDLIRMSGQHISLDYMATVLADVAGLFIVDTKVSIGGRDPITIKKTDTITILAGEFRISAGQVISGLLMSACLNPGKVLGLLWITTNPKGWSLTQVAEYFSASISELIDANKTVKGILKAGVVISTHKPYTIKDTDTFGSVLTALEVTTSDLPSGLIENADIFAGKKIGLLVLQSTCTFSTATVPLVEGTSILSYLIRDLKGRDANAKNVFFNMQYAINGMEIHDEPVSFVVPLDVMELGTTCVPLPLKKCPTPPTLIEQNEKTRKNITTIEDAKEWEYGLSYSKEEKSQDEILVEVHYNQSRHSAPSNLSSSAKESTTPDLFEALACFMEVYQPLLLDLDKVTKVKNSPALSNSTGIALTAFANIVQQVATAWSSWPESKQILPRSDADFTCSISEYVDGIGNLEIEVTKTSGDIPGSYSLPLIIPDASCWTPVANPFNPPQHKETVIYTFAPVADSPLDKVHVRTISFKKLDLLNVETMWTGLSLERNKNLVLGYETGPGFVYTTSVVKFVNKVAPTVVSDDALSIATIIKGGTVLTPQKRTLVGHLSALFENLLEMGLPYHDEHGNLHLFVNKHFYIKITCSYIYGINSQESTPLIVKSPVLHHPGVSFTIHDWEMSATAEQSFVQRLAVAIHAWQETNSPETHQGQYVFDLAVFNGASKAQKVLNFLTENNTYNLPGSISRTEMPLSFYVPNEYWTTPPNNQEAPYSVKRYAERALAYFGADIYDVATMQVALSLYPNYKRGLTVADNWTKRLRSGFSGTLGDYKGKNGTIRGWTTTGKNGNNFKYGGNTGIPMPVDGMQAAGAYFFRMISDQYEFNDPLTGDHLWPGKYKKSNTGSKKLDGTPMTWIDWKPITGENAWAAFIGPLQLLYRKTGALPTFDSPEVQLALSVLPAYDDMQWKDPSDSSRRGAIFYAPENSAANIPGQLVNPYGVSNENNFSSYGGLTILMQILSAAYVNEKEASKKPLIEAQFSKVKELASGIKSYFAENLCYKDSSTGSNKGKYFFYTGGEYGTQATGNTGTFTGGGPGYMFAVDVHTWGCAVLGVKNVDTWFGTHK
ncbi:MAG: hypothetical protein GKR95_25440 [Gammaproteobacteria bacterium]|nr:hypothetical protein [Gammaproteobacteria bacterium]